MLGLRPHMEMSHNPNYIHSVFYFFSIDRKIGLGLRVLWVLTEMLGLGVYGF